jgi:hypothetical protein
MTYLWVALGSALGGVARHWCSGVAARLWGESFPWGTIIVNVAGSLRHRPVRDADGARRALRRVRPRRGSS